MPASEDKKFEMLLDSRELSQKDQGLKWTSIAEFLSGEQETTLSKLHFHLPHLDSIKKLEEGKRDR